MNGINGFCGTPFPTCEPAPESIVDGGCTQPWDGDIIVCNPEIPEFEIPEFEVLPAEPDWCGTGTGEPPSLLDGIPMLPTRPSPWLPQTPTDIPHTPGGAFGEIV